MKPLQMGRFRLAAPLLALAAGGCFSDSSGVEPLPRVSVQGTITLDGKPVPEGKLQFQPDASSSGIMVVGEITDGKFAIDRASGPIPGKYRVTVSSRPVFKLKPGADPGGTPPPSGPETIPKWYTGVTSKLVADVKSDSPQVFDFTLSSKNP